MQDVVPMRLGDAYQAEIPPLLTRDQQQQQQQQQQRRDRHACRQVWSPEAFSEHEVTEFLRCTRLTQTEPALRCLHESGYDVHKATQLLHHDRQRQLRTQRQRLHAISDEAFEVAIYTHEKLFFAIAQQHPGVATADLVARFYQWKTTTSYKKWRERIKNKKNKEAMRLRQWADASAAEESDAAEDFHNEHCDLCFTGGQLLCCDGCERAFHFSCVDPPIREVPRGDWFCSACASVLGTELRERASVENPFCMENVVNDSAPSDDEMEEIGNGPVATGATTTGGEADGDGDGGDGTDEIESETENGGDQTLTTQTKSDRAKELVAVKQEPVPVYQSQNQTQNQTHHQQQRLYTPERMQRHRPVASTNKRHAESSKSPLAVELLSNSGSNRKRQRKIVAPRRIPQSEVADATTPGAPPAPAPPKRK